MKKISIFCIFLVLITATALGQTKVACVGNSITYGAFLPNRAQNSYPAQLQEMLGSQYEVKNFGRSGATLLQKGNLPYMQTEEFKKALEFSPHIVLIKLGTNDSKKINRPYLDQFKNDYNLLIKAFKEKNPAVRIILLTPIRAFTQPDSINITAEVIQKKITPMVEEIAFENKIEIIHLDRLFTKNQTHLIGDKIHPTSIGMNMIAIRIFEYLHVLGKQEEPIIGGNYGRNLSNFFGHTVYHFKYMGFGCKIAIPKKQLSGKPFVWRARFWGHQPQTDIEMLERGYHIVYCDVANLFGSPKAVSRWNLFYTYLQIHGFAQKAILEGMSRGGLIVYNWAAANPKKVACIYADAPVLDLKSWPMNKGIKEETAMMDAYRFVSKEQILKYKKNPIDKTGKILKGKYPILHICGADDSIVPMKENTLPFAENIKNGAGNIKVISKPGIGHHPHSLDNPAEIVQMMLSATNYPFDRATLPIPGAEFRAGAQWTPSTDWWGNHKEISQIIAQKQPYLLLIGNSITQGFGGSRELLLHKPGKIYLDSLLKNKRWESAGIAGDKTDQILYRIQTGEYEKGNPQVVVLTIGINNIGYGDSPESTFEGIKACIQAIRQKMPQAQLIVYGTLPAGERPESPLRIATDKIESLMSAYNHKEKGFVYRNPTTLLIQRDGKLKEGCYSSDFLHLSPKGYEVWAQDIVSQLSK